MCFGCCRRIQPLDAAERKHFTKQAEAHVEPGFKLVMKEKVGRRVARQRRAAEQPVSFVWPDEQWDAMGRSRHVVQCIGQQP